MSQFKDLYRGRRVLVTGHTGFKGSWLVMWLQHLGADVSGFSDRVSTTPAMFDLLDLGGKMKHRLGDIRDRARLAEVIDEVQPEFVFHLAAQALVLESHKDPLATFETNIMGMANLLECIRERPWIKVAVLVTSDKAYRNNEWDWGYRETDVLGGLDPYSGSKSCAELVVHSYYHSFLQHAPTKIATARAGNVIGGGDWAANRLVPDCIRAWSAGETVRVRRPQATRPWQHVLEPLSGYLWLGACLYHGHDGLDGEPINFGPDSQQDMTVADLIDAMSTRWPGVRWEAGDQDGDDGLEATLLRLSCEKAMQRLGWRAVLDLPTTVKMTVEWYRQWSEENASLHSLTIKQIEHYTNIASSSGLAWSSV